MNWCRKKEMHMATSRVNRIQIRMVSVCAAGLDLLIIKEGGAVLFGSIASSEIRAAGD